MTKPDARTLRVRSLNETRLLHPPTYVASRLLADSIASEATSGWTPAAILRKFPLQRTPRLFEIVRLKKAPPGQQLEYRHYLIPSLMTSLAEAITLSELATTAPFRRSNRVFSHLWPRSPDYPYNFQYYVSDYKRRNRAITAAFRRDPARIAVVTDIRRFYPSIRHDLLRDRFYSALDQRDVAVPVRDTAGMLLHHITAHFKGRGIATGPQFSHTLANVLLAEVDRDLETRYPQSYFRYIDEIILVVDRRDQNSASQRIAAVLGDLGLELNADKTDVVSGEEWLGNGPDYRPASRESFHALVFRLKLYIALRPHRFGELSSAFAAEGFNIPLGRIRTASTAGRFRKAVELYYQRGWKVVLEALLDTPASLVRSAHQLRVNFLSRLSSLAAVTVPDGPARRRWHVNRLRFLINRLLYLAPISEWGLITEAISKLHEFADTNALLRLLRSGDVSTLLNMPGPAVTAAASLLHQIEGPRGQVKLPSNLTFPQIHSASILLLFGVARGPVEGAFQTSESARDFLAFCSEQTGAVRSRNDFTYLDEIQAVQIIPNHDDFVEERLERDFFRLKPATAGKLIVRRLHNQRPALKPSFNRQNNYFYL